MPNSPAYTRPPFEEALQAWQALLRQHGFANELLWIFEENLCFEPDSAQPRGFRLGFQTAFTPPPSQAERIAYEHFAETDARLVFYRAGECRGKSVCLVLCDPWFENKSEPDGYLRRDRWLMSFRPGTRESIEEIADRQRWEKRLIRDRPLHELDFCMTLRAVHETLAHGRVLSAYERYALKFLHAWGRWLGSPHVDRKP
jgi:hypothetical protein